MQHPEDHHYIRRLGDGLVVFESETWQTLVLPPASTVIVDVIMERAIDGRLSMHTLAEEVRNELEIDATGENVHKVVEVLRSAGLLELIEPEET